MYPATLGPRQARNQLVTLLLGLAMGVGVAALAFTSRGCKGGGGPEQSVTVAARGDLADDEQSSIEVFERAAPAVVFITTLTRQRASPLSFNVMEIPKGTGSGFIWGDGGHIVTNFHVVAEGDAFRATLANHKTYDATFVGAEPSKDLAVLRIEAPANDIVALPVGTSHDLRVGQKVFAIGNPFGLDHTLTTGVVSALGREIKAANGRTIEDVVQTDAAINPGNSGGPLLDSAGRLIGINTAIYSPSGASSGIGFAVPVDTVANVVPQLIQHGRVIQPGLGVQLVTDRLAARLGLAGPMIRGVRAGGAAERAGLQGVRKDAFGRIVLGDVITHVAGERTPNSNALLNALEHHDVGATINISIVRGKARRDVSVTLEQVR